MKHHFFLLLVILAGPTAVCAQHGADTQLIARDTSRAAAVPAVKSRTVRRAPQGPLTVSLPKATKDSLIRNIRAVFQRINSDSTLRAVDLDFEAFIEAAGEAPDNGGEIRGYFRNDTIYKLVMGIGLSFGPKEYEYYYERGQVVFVYEKDSHFAVKDGGLDHDHLVLGFEGRFYFNKGRLIEKIIKRYDQFMAGEIDENYINYLLDDTSIYIAALRKQMKKK